MFKKKEQLKLKVGDKVLIAGEIIKIVEDFDYSHLVLTEDDDEVWCDPSNLKKEWQDENK